VEIIPVEHIEEVLEVALVPQNREVFLNKLKKLAAEPAKVFESSTGAAGSHSAA